MCVLHCLFTPILLIVIPSLAGVALLNDETFHRVMLFFVVPSGVLALAIGYSHHQKGGVSHVGIGGSCGAQQPFVAGS
jgi:hypothetical protein